MAAIGWYLKYGNYRHDDCECWFSEERQQQESAEKVPMFIACRWDIHGRIQADTPALVKAKQLALVAAYKNQNQNAGWYLAAGGTTAHQVIAAQTIRGVRVSRPPQFPDSKGAEGCTFRNYTLTLEWEEPPNVLKQLLTFEQTIKQAGNGGPDWDVIAGVIGVPKEMQKTQGSKVVIVQSGRAVGSNYYPEPAEPIWPGEPPLHGPSVNVDHYKIPGPALERATSWSYTFFFSRLPRIPNP